MSIDTLRYRVLAPPEGQALRACAKGTGNGWVEGYLAVFGNVDSQKERIVRGAFSKSIQERVPAGKVPLMTRHFLYGGDVGDVVGNITQAKEDDYGLWIHADLSAVQAAQELRVKIHEGSVWGLSVGYEVLRWQTNADESGKVESVDLLECKLVEGTVTVRPANERAVITAAKSIQDEISAFTTGQAGGVSLPPGAVESLATLSAKIDHLVGLLPCPQGATLQVARPGSPVDYDEVLAELHEQERLIALLTT